MHPEENAKIVLLPFRPHTLAYKLNCLFNAGVITPETLAKSVAVPIYRVDRWARGTAEPDPVTRVQVDKVLSYYRRLSFRHLKLEEGSPDEAYEPQYTRGVKEDLDAFDGTRSFTMRDHTGKRIFHCTMPAGTPEQALTDFLESWMEDLDPTIHLEPSSPHSASSA